MKLPVVLNEPPNVFNEQIVHRDLEENRGLWNHVAYIRQIVGVYGLEDCQVNGINYYLVAAPGVDEQLIDLVSSWKPGRVEWASLEEQKRFAMFKAKLSIRPPKILKVTWVV
jgi:hypothetical protein